MAVIKVTNSKGSLKALVNYVNQEEKTSDKLKSGINCNAETALEEMQTTKELHHKTDGRQYFHYVQSFSPEDKISPEKAHKLGKEWAENNFTGHEVLITTHTDKDHLHNHFIVNSVNMETGQKLQQSKSGLQELKNKSDLICEREGLKILAEKTPGKEISRNEYQVAVRGESWKFKLMNELDEAMAYSKNKADFIKLMESKGYKVNWTDSRKYITYTTPYGKKVRDNKLHDNKYTKEVMESGFERLKENELNRADYTRNATNVDWSAIECTLRNEKNGVSEQPSNEVTGTIQQQVRAVEERTQRATGINKAKGKELGGQQSNVKRESKPTVEPVKTKISSRDWGIER